MAVLEALRYATAFLKFTTFSDYFLSDCPKLG